MINWLVGLALRKRLVVAMVCVFAGLYGAYSWTQLPIRGLSGLSPDPSSQVVTQAPGLAAEEVEQQITIPLERQLSGTPGLLFMRSKSTFGLSLITVGYRDGIEDHYWSRLRLTRAHPERGAAAQSFTRPRPFVFADRLHLLLHARDPTPRRLRELSELQRWTVIPAPQARVRGIADAYRTSVASPPSSSSSSIPSSSMRFNLSLANVEAAIVANSASAGGSVVARGETGYVIRGIGLVQTLEDMGRIVVTQRNGTPILLRDLGKLKLANQERHGVLAKNEKNDAVEGTVLLLKGDNLSRVMDGVQREGQGAQCAACGR